MLIRFQSSVIAALAAAAVFTSGCGGGLSGALPAPPAGVSNDPSPPMGAKIITSSVTRASWVPVHVQNYTFWQYDGVGTGIPASYMAAWATWVLTAQSSYANEFHAAGGKYTVAYTDPNYYYVGPGYKAPGYYPESAFGHGSNGTRTQRPEGGGTEYYLNPASLASQSGYLGIVRTIAANGGYNYIYADGVSDSLPMSLYRMWPTPVEITTSTAYVGGMKALLGASPLPIILNGYNNGSPLTEESEYIGARSIGAGFGEGCFTNRTDVVTDTQYQQLWTGMANALLATTSRGYPAICAGRGELTDNRAERTYYLASWWLTYNAYHSVSFELISSPGNVYLFPEQAIVPTGPLATETNVANYKWWTGAYERRFDACYYKQVLWGACAAVVNPSWANTVRIPPSTVYHHSLALDNNNLYDGGQASLSTYVPTTLAPGTAVILFQ